MSNLERDPSELTCTARPEDGTGDTPRGRLLEPREVPLGGPRGMRVRRTLPQRSQPLIGAWCFADHFGPDDVSSSGGMQVAGHPHTGLQTVSWLFTGEVEHRDTAGTHALVRPGELNLMTAGSGIAHSEYSTPGTSVLHGAQLWVALPEADRFTAPGFEHYAPPVVALDDSGAQARVFLGSLAGSASPVKTFTPLLGAELTLPAGASVRLAVSPSFEHGVLVDTGEVTAAGCTAGPGHLIHREPGTDTLTLTASPSTDTRVLLLGGEPLGEQIMMWWNFIGRTHEEIVAFREEWQSSREPSAPVGRYGPFPTAWHETLPAPSLPNARLRLRG